MKKKIIFCVVLLVIILGGVLFWKYNASDKTEEIISIYEDIESMNGYSYNYDEMACEYVIYNESMVEVARCKTKEELEDITNSKIEDPFYTNSDVGVTSELIEEK